MDILDYNSDSYYKMLIVYPKTNGERNHGPKRRDKSVDYPYPIKRKIYGSYIAK